MSGALESILLRQIGLVYLCMNSNHVRASVRQVVTDTPAPLLTAEHGERCRGRTLVAHSWGAVVALDALVALRREPGVAERPLTLLTVGAGLSRAWWLAPRDALWTGLAEMRDWFARIRFAPSIEFHP